MKPYLMGITWNSANIESYLYTNQTYWTMSPYHSYPDAGVFAIHNVANLIMIALEVM